MGLRGKTPWAHKMSGFFFCSFKIINTIYTSIGLLSCSKWDATACHVTAASSHSLSELVMCATSQPPSLTPNARQRDFLVIFLWWHSLAPKARQRVLVCFIHHHHPPLLQVWDGGVLSCLDTDLGALTKPWIGLGTGLVSTYSFFLFLMFDLLCTFLESLY
jgi:hypothetical protein